LDDSTGRVDVWVLSTITNRAWRLTRQPRFSAVPAWSPDGRRIAYMARSAAGKEDFDIFVRSADGTGPETCLVCAPDTQTGAEWTPDGRFVLYESVSPRGVASGR
jgi:TolB protein